MDATITPHGKAFLLASDDQSFAELLLHFIQTRENDFANAVKVLYESWALERLQLMRRQNPAVFFGSFLSPIRRLYPKYVFIGDLYAAMGSTLWESSGEGGDLLPAAFHAEAMDYYHNGGQKGTYPGWFTVSKHYTVRPGEFTVVTGIASHMKSMFVQALCINLARDADWNIGIFSPEHYPPGNLARGLVECTADLRFADMPVEMVDDTMRWVAKHFHPIIPPEEVAPTLPWILGAARHQIRTYGLQGLIIDPWNEVDHYIAGRQNETQYISEALSIIRRFARHHSIHVWLVAHPTKMQKAASGDYKDKYPPPTPYDISGSAHWYNKADNCLCVWRDVWEDSATIQLHVQKVRNRSVGYPGLVELYFTGQRFIEETAVEVPSWQA